MTPRKSIDEQLIEMERNDRMKRDEKAHESLFRIQLEGLISVAKDGGPIKAKLIEALELYKNSKD
jgi:hypothetical protein